jgi:spore germination cell wall hydrolase CwlJ-like protein
VSLAALCLASVIYAEARGEPVDGQIAVGQVILNRVEGKHWPDDVCAVAEQPRQFASLMPDQERIDLATAILNGEHDDLSSGATHFYSGSDPWWAERLIFVGTIAGHTFMEEVRT